MKSPSSSTDHIRFGKAGLVCQHCGTTQPVAYSIAIKAYVRLGKAFTRIHKHCIPTA